MKSIFRAIRYLIVFYLVIQMLMTIVVVLFQEVDEEFFPAVEFDICEEYEVTDSTAYPELVKTHYRSWVKYDYDSGYCMNYRVSSRLQERSASARNRISIYEGLPYNQYWRQVYSELYRSNRDMLSFVQDSLRRIATRYSLSRFDFARLVVSFVQDIPYNYIDIGNCEDKRNAPCVGNVRFGLLAPVEFLYSLSGDCDTRTVLLYTLFRNFGYDPLIVNSIQYRHSMLALPVPAAGDSFRYRGRTYYYWETTGTGWQPGMLPPEMTNQNYWMVLL